MLSNGREGFSEFIDDSDERMEVIEALDENQIKKDQHGLKLTLEIQSRNVGTTEDEIEADTYYEDVISNNEQIKNSIITHYLSWREGWPPGLDVSNAHEFVDRVLTDINDVNDRSDGDLDTVLDNISKEDVDSAWAKQCFTLQIIINGQ
ncbi:MAG: hypothetical protein ABEI86_06725 [Halobacteriaceae archaeon]